MIIYQTYDAYYSIFRFFAKVRPSLAKFKCQNLNVKSMSKLKCQIKSFLIFKLQFSIFNEFTMNQFLKYQSSKFKAQMSNQILMSKSKINTTSTLSFEFWHLGLDIDLAFGFWHLGLSSKLYLLTLFETLEFESFIENWKLKILPFGFWHLSFFPFC